MVTKSQISEALMPIAKNIKLLRIQCRLFGVNPAGGVAALNERLTERMIELNDW